jgi:hypothetical protein
MPELEKVEWFVQLAFNFVSYVRKTIMNLLLMKIMKNEKQTCFFVENAPINYLVIRKVNPLTKIENLNLVNAVKTVELPV